MWGSSDLNLLPPPPGTAWTEESLWDVVAIAPNDVWAVGDRLIVPSSGSPTRYTLYLHWDGATLQAVPGAPLPGGTTSSGLRLLAGAGPCDLWATGSFQDAGGSHSLVERHVPGQGGGVVVDLKGNGSDGPLNLTTADLLTLTITVDPGSQAGQRRDWWLWAEWNGTTTYWRRLQGGWVVSSTPVRTWDGALLSLTDYFVDQGRLPAGQWLFRAAVDALDGVLQGTDQDLLQVDVQ